MKKKMIFCSGMLIIVCLILYIQYGIPKHIDVEYPAVIYRMSDKSIFQKTRIEIHLKKYKVWNSSPKYLGNIKVEAYDFTKQSEMRPINFVFDDYKSGFLTYVTWLTNKTGAVTGSAIDCLGSVWKVSDFKSMTILVFEPTSNSNTKISKDLYISAPANTREEAIKITEACKILYEEE